MNGSLAMEYAITGMIHGTPSYMAPEVALGKGPVDGRADLYALGCVGYWLLTGRLVFDETTYPAMLLAHAQHAPDPPSRHAGQAIPKSLDSVVLSCLVKDPAGRVQSAEDLAARLAAVELAERWTRERATQWWEAHAADGSPEEGPPLATGSSEKPGARN